MFNQVFGIIHPRKKYHILRIGTLVIDLNRSAYAASKPSLA
jgi:hypothetical protein